jgi:prepilin-type N-terminal cleavage/methylation domain-containing protein
MSLNTNAFFLRRKQMISRKGFTLIELMVVIFIVGILAAVAIPIVRGRIDAAKWSEGKAAAGSIRTAARAYIAEKGNTFGFATHADLEDDLGFADTDLNGKYFKQGDYVIVFTNSSDTAVEPSYLITVTAHSSSSTECPSTPTQVTLDNAGTFVD